MEFEIGEESLVQELQEHLVIDEVGLEVHPLRFIVIRVVNGDTGEEIADSLVTVHLVDPQDRDIALQFVINMIIAMVDGMRKNSTLTGINRLVVSRRVENFKIGIALPGKITIGRDIMRIVVPLARGTDMVGKKFWYQVPTYPEFMDKVNSALCNALMVMIVIIIKLK